MTKQQNAKVWIDLALTGSSLESALVSAGFSRRDDSLTYVRQLPEILQRFKLVFDVNPKYEPQAVAHLLPQVVFESPILGDIVRQMEGDSSMVPEIVNLVLRHQLQNLAPKGEQRQRGSRWFLHDEADAVSLISDIGGFTGAYVLPFLNQYRDIASLAQGFGAGDERLRMDRRLYLYMAAAFVHANLPDKALGVLQEVFGRPGPRKQYARAFEYVRGKCVQ